jgi:H+-transporting ATPase
MKANVDPLMASDSSPGSETKAKNTLSSAPKPESASKLRSAANEPKHIETQNSPPTTSATPASSVEAQKVISGGLTSDEARRRLAKSGPNAMPDTSVHPLRVALEKF